MMPSFLSISIALATSVAIVAASPVGKLISDPNVNRLYAAVSEDAAKLKPYSKWKEAATLVNTPNLLRSSSSSSSASSKSSRKLLAASSTPGWATEHHDMRNTGQAEYDGPANADGICRFSFYQYGGSPFLAETVDMFSTGVTSIYDENALLFGGTDNIFRIARLGVTILDTWACDLETFTNRTLRPAATSFGLIGSGTTWTFVDSGTSQTFDRIALPSADGSVYALNWEACALGAGGKQAVCNHTIDGVPITPTNNYNTDNNNDNNNNKNGDGFTIGGGPSCVQFVTNFPSNDPLFSPTRYVPASIASGVPAGGIVLASTTHAVLDTNGILYGLNADTGAILWNHAAIANVSNVPTTFGLRGVAPAVDALRGGLLYLAYGPRVVAIYPGNGTVAASFQISQSGSDGFVSSPVLTADSSALLLHSSLGSIWRISLKGMGGDASGQSQLTFSVAWACDYTLADSFAGTTNCSAIKEDGPAFEYTTSLPHATLPVWEWDLATGGRTLVGSRTVPRTEFVSGGWNQLMTRSERDALYREMALIVGLEEGETLEAASDGSTPAAVAAAGRRALKLTPEQLDSIGTPKDLTTTGSTRFIPSYERLDGTGKPRSVARAQALRNGDYSVIRSGPQFESTYPYATPSINKFETYLVVPQFVTFGAGDTGLFVANLTTGLPVWTFSGIYGIVTIPFGRSRSSATFDADGGLYVAADVDFVNNDTLPLLFAWQEKDPVLGPGGGYFLRWVNDMGLTEQIIVGSASPVVKFANSSQYEVVMASGDGVNGFREGLPCATNDDAVPCSEHGDCNCFSGLCECYSGWKGDDCATAIPIPPPDTIAKGALVMVGVTVGSLGAVVGVAILVALGKAYGLPTALKTVLGIKPPVDEFSGSGGLYGTSSSSSGASYDTRPLMIDATPGEKSGLLSGKK